MQRKVTDMAVGERGFFDGDLVELRDGGKSGGCPTDLFLAFIASPGSPEWQECADCCPDIIVGEDDEVTV
jgi:hypothetical protein